MHFVLIKLYF